MVKESSLNASGGINTQTAIYYDGESAVARIIRFGTFVVKYSKVF